MNPVLLVALFSSGGFPFPWVGVILSAVGALLSFAWDRIQARVISDN